MRRSSSHAVIIPKAVPGNNGGFLLKSRYYEEHAATRSIIISKNLDRYKNLDRVGRIEFLRNLRGEASICKDSTLTLTHPSRPLLRPGASTTRRLT